MKFTLPWLKEHLETRAGPGEIAARMTGLGLEVDRIEARGSDLSAFSVAEVTGVRRHPDAERLNLCTVETGRGEPLEVVCGAPNVHLGMKAVFAPVGATIPESGEVLKRATIRGVVSNGMLCSARELRLGDDHEGIIELDPGATVGSPASEVLASEGPVFDVELTPNRSDCFGVIGIARDLAAAGLGELKGRDLSPAPAAFETDFTIRLDFPEGEGHACPLYVGRVFRGVTNRPSPPWLRERLSAVGLRPISALVDITNLVTLDLNRPLHVFDANKLRGRQLTIRSARAGEALEALDGHTYDLRPGMTVIADEGGPVGLGGIMGGEESGCDAATTDVVLEVALFDPNRTAATGRALQIESDARTRFERGLDPGMVIPGMEHATRLILELCGGEASQPIIAGEVPGPRPPIRFRMAQLERLTGIALHGAVIERHVKALGFGAEWVEDGVLQVWPPSWRPDVTMEADIVEELVRLHGYDKVPPMPVTRTAAVGQSVLTPEQRIRGIVRRSLAARGLAEAVTWSFTEPELAARFGNAGMQVRNPLNAELSVMRPSLLPNLLAAAARNQARSIANVALFEVAARFIGSSPGEQEMVAGGIRCGQQHERHWLDPARPIDVFDARADAVAALAAAQTSTDALRVVADGPDHYHPGRKGRLTLGPQTVLAEFGEIHPAIQDLLDLEGPVVGFEVFLDRLPKPKTKRRRARPPLKASPFPAVDRDFAFVVEDEVPAEDLLGAVRNADKTLIREVGLFDVYAGTGLAPGQRSLAVAVRLQAPDRTLGEEEIEQVVRKIVAAAAKATGATLRA
jgi:phenylalanyl-tRNA synthetase beta chain